MSLRHRLLTTPPPSPSLGASSGRISRIVLSPAANPQPVFIQLGSRGQPCQVWAQSSAAPRHPHAGHDPAAVNRNGRPSPGRPGLWSCRSGPHKARRSPRVIRDRTIFRRPSPASPRRHAPAQEVIRLLRRSQQASVSWTPIFNFPVARPFHGPPKSQGRPHSPGRGAGPVLLRAAATRPTSDPADAPSSEGTSFKVWNFWPLVVRQVFSAPQLS
ncbi:hypothetical protein NDU88_003940 [Pleurodeles waltl]|uniref:Uncharacterized protein n=1 Tax=Pleurodeles waltl TaxID=8319 RepID=A0AAV7T841_PLEWA|nr:hypothetical protein NDU88_003940 [Pleurodeles waltl]